METALWFLISEEDQAKFRAMMPKTWKPPRSEGKVINLDCQLEDVDEISKLMRIPTKGRKVLR